MNEMARGRTAFFRRLQDDLDNMQEQGLSKVEHVLTSPQNTKIQVDHGKELINFCANNYLGLADHLELIKAARAGVEKYGFGMASVRVVCGTLDIHKDLEQQLSDFLKTEDTLLYGSCFDANGGLFETLLGPEDAVISDALNHASIIDGIRLCKAGRFRYANNDMADLEKQLKAADEAGARIKLIVTDGVFSMDGIIANLPGVCDLAEKYDALVMVDDSHGVGVVGDNGRGSLEYCGVEARVDVITGTLGKALGGASGGYTSGRREIIQILRQRSRSYIFTNSVAPVIVAASLRVLELLEKGNELREQLHDNSRYFRDQMIRHGFTLAGADHPIIPVMIGDEHKAKEMGERLMTEGIFVVGFTFPIVPLGQARIRTQISAIHTREQLDIAINAFARIGRELSVI